MTGCLQQRSCPFAIVVKQQPADHVLRIAEFAMDTVAVAQQTLIDEDDPSKGYVQIRVGFHIGPVVADVIGDRNPKFCILGDTVNIASRMESNSLTNRIHCSERAAELLKQQQQGSDMSSSGGGGVRLVSRGIIPIKGKGEMETFWVERAVAETIKEECLRGSAGTADTERTDDSTESAMMNNDNSHNDTASPVASRECRAVEKDYPSEVPLEVSTAAKDLPNDSDPDALDYVV